MPETGDEINKGKTTTEMAEELKETGNELFKLDKFEASNEAYTKALELQPDNNKLRMVLYKNRAMTRLKLEDYEGAEMDCDRGA
jgi:tetratricopeptide (TPR) repeat protein